MSRWIVAIAVMSLLCPIARGEIPFQINHQGVIRVNDEPFDGTGEFRFALVDPVFGTNVWTNDGSNAGTSATPALGLQLPVGNGVYDVMLGDTFLNNMTSIPPDAFNSDKIVLRIWFDDLLGNGLRKLEPDHLLGSAPYAFNAEHAGFAEMAHAVESFNVPHYITGCELEYYGDDSILVTPGSFELGGMLLTRKSSAGPLLASVSSSWLAGGSERADAWLYVYLGENENSWEAFFADLPPMYCDLEWSVQGTARYEQFDGNWYRCVGAVRNNSSKNLLPFVQSGDHVIWNVPIQINNMVSEEVWSADISCASGIPSLARMGLFGLGAQDMDGQAAGVWIKPAGSTWPNDFENGVYSQGGGTGVYISGQRWCMTDTGQQISYFSDMGDEYSYIDVEGYILRR